ncbi:hypothetical protein LTR37_012658 [Vermiconidia calcicola]|uniref:Uncharacterized protein n=1 Tax=Vermiconidia calcicola TaxID=1690605 RepID=A0ACC3MYQ4_9PEZI|nr:hypothetical protein LTR37_012658 [Vermiconidia calcicola]
MPAIAELLAKRAGVVLESIEDRTDILEAELLQYVPTLGKRVEIPCCNSSSPPGLVEAATIDPWQESGKYALAWVYFSIILLVLVSAMRWYHFWHDKIRTAVHKGIVEEAAKIGSPDPDPDHSGLSSAQSTKKFFPKEGPLPGQPKPEPPQSSTSRPIYAAIALFRLVFYRPIPTFRLRYGWRRLVFPSPGIILVVVMALALVVCYTFIPQPLYWSGIRFGSPPVAIRSGMLAVAMMPWIVALSMKANFISMMTGIGHERLNVLHRWAAYICLLLSLVHTIPFYVAPVIEKGGYAIFRSYFADQHFYVYGTGIAALVPLIFLCLHSLPPLRRRFYELFVMIHVPISIVLLAMLFWHCHNYLTSWSYLFATMAIWLASYTVRLFYLNWTNPWRMSWLIGEEAAVTLLPESAVKITIPTQVKWKPGQYVYLRMPGVSVFENHPFTIASLCSDDFPSGYGDEYRDMVLVFRPYGGFTKKVVESALEHGPWHTYRAFLDGPYGGMSRSMESFDHVVMIAGGSGITAVVSQLLDLIKRMRDGRAVTKTVQLVWALKRPETMEWFKEELRICREFAPPDAVHCQFYITAAKRQTGTGAIVSAQTPSRPVSTMFHDKVNDMFQNIASNRFSDISSRRTSAMIHDEAQGDPEREKQLREEGEDRLRPLPQAHYKTMQALHGNSSPHRGSPLRHDSDQSSTSPAGLGIKEMPHMPPHPTLHEKRRSRSLSLDISVARQNQAIQMEQLSEMQSPQQFDFGFPSTPTEFQKNLMRFAFMPAAVKSRKSGWSTEWGRPDIPYMLKEMSEQWTGRRTCVFVCGPPAMRVDVSNTIAELQKTVLHGQKDEIFLHAENYAL